jgi:hypothetical protein
MTKQKNNFTHKILLITLFKSQSTRLKIIKKPHRIKAFSHLSIDLSHYLWYNKGSK